jgi:hypothetical protein
MFILEQEEYKREGLELQPTIDLIEKVKLNYKQVVFYNFIII